MAIRKHPLIGAIGAGLSQGVDTYLQMQKLKALSDKANKGAGAADPVLARELLGKLISGVQSGDTSPDQFDATAQRLGTHLPLGTGSMFEPSQTQRVSSIADSITKAPTFSDVPTDATLATAAKAKRLPLLGFGAMPEPPPADGDLPSDSMGPVSSPAMAQLFSAAKAKRESFPAVAQPTTINGTPATTYLSPGDAAKPRTVLTSATPEQAGANEANKDATRESIAALSGVPGLQGRNAATKEVAQLDAELAGGVPGKKGAATLSEAKTGSLSPQFTQLKGAQEAGITNATAVPAARAAGLTAGAQAQARSNVENDPANLQKATTAKVAMEQALDEYRFPPEAKAAVLKNSMGTGAMTQAPYAVVDRATMDPQSIKAVSQGAAKAGTKVISTKDQQALREIGNANNSLNMLLDAYMPTAAKTPGARGIQAPANRLASLLQTNPELASADKLFGPTISVLKATMGGTSGMRISDMEIRKAQEQMPQATDTAAVVQKKVGYLKDMLESYESGILGR